jgi:GNAT superfamily N-acetyltransferase
VEAARAAAATDLDRIAELWAAARTELAGQERGGPLYVAREGRSPAVTDLPSMIGAADSTIVVGAIDEVIVGYATGRTEPLPDGTALGVIEDLFVEEGGRGVGVGEAMMERLLEWFGERNVIGVDAVALPGMRATKNFFETSGFSARLIVMHHRMNDAT